MNDQRLEHLRRYSRQLVRELGMLELNMSRSNRAPQHWHTLIEIANSQNITISQLGRLLLLSSSNMSRIVTALLKEKLIMAKPSMDKREKFLQITDQGLQEIKSIDKYSLVKIKGAFEFLNKKEQDQIIDAIESYAKSLEKSRLLKEKIKVHTLSTSRALRKQIIALIENIQIQEFDLPINDEINSGILKAEDEYYYNQSYNFWYATDASGTIIGSIGLKKIDARSAELKKFFVAVNYRGKGVSTKLLHTLVKAAKKHRFKSIYLGTVDVLKAGQRFYEKYGFEKIPARDLPKTFERCHLDTTFLKGELKTIEPLITLQIVND